MRFYTSLLALAAATVAVPAFAGDSVDCGSAPKSEWMSVEAVAAKFEADGYKVREVKVEDSCYEVYAIDKTGARVETYINPATAAVVETRTDD